MKGHTFVAGLDNNFTNVKQDRAQNNFHECKTTTTRKTIKGYNLYVCSRAR